MKKIDVTINKASVYDEVAKTTSYIGAKTTDANGSNTYDKVFTTDEDRVLLERYWNEACGILTNALREYLYSVSEFAPFRGVDLYNNYSVTLQLPDNFDENTKGTITSQLFSFFVNFVVGKWLESTDLKKSPEYIKAATDYLSVAQSLIHNRKRPTK